MSALPLNDRLAGPFPAEAGQTDFPADFPLVEADPSDPAGAGVYVERERDGQRTQLSLTTGFTVHDPSDEPPGFTARLVAPAEAGDVYWVVGRIPAKRGRAHAPGGQTKTPTLEGDARQFAAALQEHARDLGRALMAPVGETGPRLDGAAARAGKVPAFSGDGARLEGWRTAADFDQAVSDTVAEREAAQAARQGAEDAEDGAVQALNDTIQAKADALEAIGEDDESGARGAAVAAVGTARTAAVAAVGTAQASAVEAIGEDDESGARGAAVAAVGTAQAAAVEAIGEDDESGARGAAVAAVQDAWDEARANPVFDGEARVIAVPGEAPAKVEDDEGNIAWAISPDLVMLFLSALMAGGTRLAEDTDLGAGLRDPEGNIAWAVGPEGTMLFLSALMAGGTRLIEDAAWAVGIRDEEGNISLGVTAEGEPVGVVPAAEAPEPAVVENRADAGVLGIHHRGYSDVAPENTLPAYVASARAGNYLVECDIQWTSDEVAVLLHDSTIDRTSDGSGAIAEMTLDQARAYDFGSWKSAEFAGTTIPTFEEFLSLCKRLSLHAWCELKSTGWTAGRVTAILDLIAQYGMVGRVTLMSFRQADLELVAAAAPAQAIARLGSLSSELIADCVDLKSGSNVVLAGVDRTTITAELVADAHAEGVGVLAWTVNSAATAATLAGYGVDGVITDSLNIAAVLREAEGV